MLFFGGFFGKNCVYSGMDIRYSTVMYVYPVFLPLAGSRVLVAGAGKVGRRKIAGLRNAGAGEIFVFDPWILPDDILALQNMSGVRVFQRTVEENDLSGCVLVFAATDDAVENLRLADLCKERGILCNVADAPEKGSFHVPACARVEGLTAAFSTGGYSPALAASLKNDAETWLEHGYGSLLVLLGRLRPVILTMNNDTARHGELFRSLVDSGLREALVRKDLGTAADILATLLPSCLHDRIEELLHGLW